MNDHTHDDGTKDKNRALVPIPDFRFPIFDYRFGFFNYRFPIFYSAIHSDKVSTVRMRRGGGGAGSGHSGARDTTLLDSLPDVKISIALESWDGVRDTDCLSFRWSAIARF